MKKIDKGENQPEELSCKNLKSYCHIKDLEEMQRRTQELLDYIENLRVKS
jgi:hypothetical protein